ncbi:MAG: type II toxin-antitoxin system RelE/ParE family toxin [Clostridia bacterium]|nr:type II toxin-antitoxin system RelE/ParE family toxin [Clostridia bacterium]
MDYTVKLSPKAHNDIKEIYEYVLKDGENIAKKQADAIYNSLERLSVFPFSGKSLEKYVSQPTDYKFIVINKLYIVFYKVEGESVEVVRILRGERDYLNELNLAKSK